MEVNIATMEAEKVMLDPNVISNSVLRSCQCDELEERSMKAEMRCVELEFELKKKKEHCEALETIVKALQGEDFAVEDELKVLRMLSEGRKRQREVCNEKEGEMKGIVDLTEDNEAVHQLMIENKVLKCEKNRAESEIELWKEKYKKLESWAIQLGMGRGSYYHEENEKKQENKPISNEGNLHLDSNFEILQNEEKSADMGNKEVGDIDSADTPSDGVCHKTPILGVLPGKKIIKQLAFETEESPSKKMAPSALVGAKSASIGVIDIIDSDDEPNITQNPVPDKQGCERISVSTYFAAEVGKNSNSNCAQNNEESLDFDEDLLFVATPKRKRTCNIVTSESESDNDDDDIPICKLKRVPIREVLGEQVSPDLSCSVPATISEDDNVTNSVRTRRRLQPLRKCVSKSQEDKLSSCRPHKAKHQKSIPTNDGADDDESEKDLASSDGENMSDFIVDDSDVSNCEETSSNSQDVCNCDTDSDSCSAQDVQDSKMDSDSQDVSDGDIDFGNILSQIQRIKSNKIKWEFEADMLAVFGKDPELCMKAVCALYRQQTAEEQSSKGSLLTNQRGFNKFDAHRGSTLADFLTDGDPVSGLKKSVEELQAYDPEAVELCRSLAIHYSKQLYEIYKNKEDAFFP